jgi:hypothetical protein
MQIAVAAVGSGTNPRTPNRNGREMGGQQQQMRGYRKGRGIHTLKMKFSSLHAVRQRKDEVSNGTRSATARREERHESVDCWWLSATQKPSRQSRNKCAEDGDAAIGVRQSVAHRRRSPSPAHSAGTGACKRRNGMASTEIE